MLVLLAAALKLAISSPLGSQQAQKDAAALSQVFSEALHQPVETSVAPHDDLPQLLAQATELHVLATSDPIPNDVIAARPGSPAGLVANLRTALLTMSKTAPGRQALDAVFHADGFAPADDADYTPLRRK
jgi:ABC-type phosphate/phosphonate transport system substrate-binding protein